MLACLCVWLIRKDDVELKKLGARLSIYSLMLYDVF